MPRTESAEVASLQLLRKNVEARRADYLEKMASGQNEIVYNKLVGRAAEAKVLLEEIDARITAVRQGDGEDEDA